MCGIAGYFNLSIRPEERLPLLRRMNDTMVYRGPDEEGYHVGDMAGLAMRRLSIIDVEGGHQPISNEDGTKHVVFNGELYNYHSLRERLQSQGHKFSTASDTEVIVHQYEQDGVQCVQQFNGMFALAIWDESEQTLFLARDRMGIKPLYYYWDGRCLLFASEIKALLASGHVPRTLNQQALWDYLTFRYVPQPESMWAGVTKLLPGHVLTLGALHHEPEAHRYWDIPYAEQMGAGCSDAESFQEFDRLFLDAVRLRLIADVPVGILLSGGLDSSSVAAAVKEVHNSRLCSFAVAFKDSPDTDERPYARQVAEHVGTEHHEIAIDDRDFVEFLPRLVHHTDEPLADLASVPLHFVSRLAREKVKVVLSGEGSDEILGGYQFDRKVRAWKWIQRFQHLPFWLRHGGGQAATRLLGRSWARRAQLANTPLGEAPLLQHFNMTNCLDSEDKKELLRSSGPFRESDDIVRSELEQSRTGDLLHQGLYVYCQSWLVEDLLTKADRMTMANSLELRVPFLDHRLVEWAARSPARIKVGRNGSGRYETKRALRQFARSRLPATILSRPKQGFPVPVYEWLSTVLRSWATDLLKSADTQLYRWLRPEPIRRQVRLGTCPSSGLMERHRLWNLLILELWMREWNPQ